MRLTKTIRKTKELDTKHFWAIIESGKGDPGRIGSEWHTECFDILLSKLKTQCPGYKLITNGYKQVKWLEHDGNVYSLDDIKTRVLLD